MVDLVQQLYSYSQPIGVEHCVTLIAWRYTSTVLYNTTAVRICRTYSRRLCFGVRLEPIRQTACACSRTRRSGKIAIWPYVMRDLPLSPVEAFRSELQSTNRNEASSPSALTAGTRHGVEYFRSCLTDEGATRQIEQDQGSRTDSDLGGLKAKLLGAGDEPPIVARTGHSAVAPAKQPTNSNALPNGPDGRGRHLPSNRLRRPSTGGPSRRPPVAPLAEAVSSLPHRGTWDRIECPSGCGEELRVTDLRHHQASLCALR